MSREAAKRIPVETPDDSPEPDLQLVPDIDPGPGPSIEDHRRELAALSEQLQRHEITVDSPEFERYATLLAEQKLLEKYPVEEPKTHQNQQNGRERPEKPSSIDEEKEAQAFQSPYLTELGLQPTVSGNPQDVEARFQEKLAELGELKGQEHLTTAERARVQRLEKIAESYQQYKQEQPAVLANEAHENTSPVAPDEVNEFTTPVAHAEVVDMNELKDVDHIDANIEKLDQLSNALVRQGHPDQAEKARQHMMDLQRQREKMTTEHREDKDLTVEAALERYLSYQDADVPPDVKRQMLENTLQSASARQYAETLLTMAETYHMTELEEVADELVEQCTTTLRKLAITPSPYTTSRSWSMWDLAKQQYFADHEEEADPKYTAEHPMESPSKMAEILGRHIGWEVYGVWHHGGEEHVRQQIEQTPYKEKILALLERQPKDNGTLSSSDLAELGTLLYTVVNPELADETETEEKQDQVTELSTARQRYGEALRQTGQRGSRQVQDELRTARSEYQELLEAENNQAIVALQAEFSGRDLENPETQLALSEKLVEIAMKHRHEENQLALDMKGQVDRSWIGKVQASWMKHPKVRFAIGVALTGGTIAALAHGNIPAASILGLLGRGFAAANATLGTKALSQTLSERFGDTKMMKEDDIRRRVASGKMGREELESHLAARLAEGQGIDQTAQALMKVRQESMEHWQRADIESLKNEGQASGDIIGTMLQASLESQHRLHRLMGNKQDLHRRRNITAWVGSAAVGALTAAGFGLGRAIGESFKHLSDHGEHVAKTAAHLSGGGVGHEQPGLGQFENVDGQSSSVEPSAATEATSQVAERTAETAREAVEPELVTIKMGGNVWKVMADHYQEHLSTLNKAQRRLFLDALKDRLEKNPELVGLKDIHHVQPGDVVDFTELDHSHKDLVEKAFDQAQHLSPEAQESILQHDQADGISSVEAEDTSPLSVNDQAHAATHHRVFGPQLDEDASTPLVAQTPIGPDASQDMAQGFTPYDDIPALPAEEGLGLESETAATTAPFEKIPMEISPDLKSDFHGFKKLTEAFSTQTSPDSSKAMMKSLQEMTVQQAGKKGVVSAMVDQMAGGTQERAQHMEKAVRQLIRHLPKGQVLLFDKLGLVLHRIEHQLKG